jgi:hypothetical protein
MEVLGEPKITPSFVLPHRAQGVEAGALATSADVFDCHVATILFPRQKRHGGIEPATGDARRVRRLMSGVLHLLSVAIQYE